MDMRSLNYGVELEVIGVTRERVARAIHSVVGGEVQYVGSPAVYDPWHVMDPQERVWKVVKDGSLINVPEHLRAEAVTPILSYGDLDVLQQIVRAIRHTGARVDGSAGLHVHVTAAPFDAPALVRFAKLFYKQEALIIAALGISAHRLNRYTKPTNPQFIEKIERHRPRTKEQLNTLWYGHYNARPQHYCPTRYHCLNLASVFFRGTIEIRCFSSTLHAGKVKSYVQYVLALAAKALNSRAASSRQREFRPESAKYDLRIHLLHIGFIGQEFRTARKHLLSLMPGDSAWKHGRPKPKLLPEAQPVSGPVEVKA